MQLEPKVVHVIEYLRPGGGPSGYLSNLRSGLLDLKDSQIAVRSYKESNDRHSDWQESRLRRTIINTIPTWLGINLIYLHEIFRWNKKFPPGELLEELTQSQVLVFHSLVMARSYMQGNLIKGQKIYIMPHSPVDFSSETISNIQNRFGQSRRWGQLHHQLCSYELKAYGSIDGIITPCQEALEGYFSFDAQKRALFETFPLHELPTGVAPFKARRTKAEVLAELGIPPHKKIIGYFGRYHHHKGFDIYVELVKRMLLAKRPEFYFISAGDGYITPPKMENYLNLGWKKDDLADYLNCVDVVMAPNRETYFDLAIIEAMSLGKPIITSFTGGNKYLSNLSEGIIVVKDNLAEGYLDQLTELNNKHPWECLGKKNNITYERYFNEKTFVNNHINFAQRALNGS